MFICGFTAVAMGPTAVEGETHSQRLSHTQKKNHVQYKVTLEAHLPKKKYSDVQDSSVMVFRYLGEYDLVSLCTLKLTPRFYIQACKRCSIVKEYETHFNVRKKVMR